MLKMERPIPQEFPKQQFSKAERLAKKMLDLTHTYDIYNREIQGKTMDLLINMIEGEMSKKHAVSRAAIITTVTDIAGQIATKDVIEPFIDRVAANAYRLYAGQPVGKFNPNGYVGWAVLEFLDVSILRPEGEKRLNFRLSPRSGLAYGHIFERSYPINHPSIDTLLYKLGASGRGSTSTPRELIRLRFWGELTSRHNTLFMQRWTIDKQLRTYNSKIVKLRRKPCPFGHKWACAKCPVGYDGIDKDNLGAPDDHCPAGCRQYTNKEKLYELSKRRILQLQEGQGLQHQGNSAECNQSDPTSSKP
jgi:hypothetical protein